MNIDMLGIQFFLLYYNQTPSFEISDVSPAQINNGFDVFEGKVTPRGKFKQMKNIFSFY